MFIVGTNATHAFRYVVTKINENLLKGTAIPSAEATKRHDDRSEKCGYAMVEKSFRSIRRS